jgi:hypothetical protein
MFLDMEMTFLAALCLMITNKIFTNAIEPHFTPFAQEVLRDMCRIPARLLQNELDSLNGLISNHHIPSFPQLASRNSSSLLDTFLDKPISMIENGLDLAHALFHVIEIPLPSGFVLASAPAASMQS